MKTTGIIILLLQAAAVTQFSLTADGSAGFQTGLSDIGSLSNNSDLVLSASAEPGWSLATSMGNGEIFFSPSADLYAGNGNADWSMEGGGGLSQSKGPSHLKEKVALGYIVQSGVEGPDAPLKYTTLTGSVEYRHAYAHPVKFRYSGGLLLESDSGRADFRQILAPSVTFSLFPDFRPGAGLVFEWNASSLVGNNYADYRAIGVNFSAVGLIQSNLYLLGFLNFSSRAYYHASRQQGSRPGNSGSIPGMGLVYFNLVLVKELSSALEANLEYVFYQVSSTSTNHPDSSHKIGAGFSWRR